jgi:hypothetical protein
VLDGKKDDWVEHVTDEEYGAATVARQKEEVAT